MLPTKKLFKEVSLRLGIPEDKVRFVVTNYFYAIRREMREVNYNGDIFMPMFCTFRLLRAPIRKTIWNQIAKIRQLEAVDIPIQTIMKEKRILSHLWSIKQKQIKNEQKRLEHQRQVARKRRKEWEDFYANVRQKHGSAG